MSADPASSNPLQAGRWSAMPTWFVERGILGSLTRSSTARTFIAMVAAARWSEGGLVKRAAKKLAHDAGISEKSVLRACHELARLGLVERVSHGGGRKNDAAEYRVAVQVERDQNRTLLSASGENRTTMPGSKPDTACPPEPDTACPPEPDTACPPLQSTEKNRAAEAAADWELDIRVLDALTVAGIGEPLRSKLAALPGLTVRMIGEEADKVSCRTNVLNKPAVIAVNLQARVAGEVKRQEHAAEAEAERARDQQREQQARQAAADEDAQGRAAIARMDDSELAKRMEQVLGRNHVNTHRWARQVKQDGPRAATLTNRWLRVAILHARPGSNGTGKHLVETAT